MGEKSASNLLKAIDRSKKTTLSRFLYALSIRGVGETTARTLTCHFHKLESLMQASAEDLQIIRDIGPVVAENIKGFFHQKYNVDLINKLIQLGIHWPEERVIKKSWIAGKSFVLTGSLKSLTRNEVKEKLKYFGGKTTNNVSKNTDYVVIGENPGSKHHKAKELGVSILDEKIFLDLLEDSENKN